MSLHESDREKAFGRNFCGFPAMQGLIVRNYFKTVPIPEHLLVTDDRMREMRRDELMKATKDLRDFVRGEVKIDWSQQKPRSEIPYEQANVNGVIDLDLFKTYQITLDMMLTDRMLNGMPDIGLKEAIKELRNYVRVSAAMDWVDSGRSQNLLDVSKRSAPQQPEDSSSRKRRRTGTLQQPLQEDVSKHQNLPYRQLQRPSNPLPSNQHRQQPPNPPNPQTSSTIPPHQRDIAERGIPAEVEKARRAMVTGIQTNMRYKQNLDWGNAFFFYVGPVPNRTIFNRLFYPDRTPTSKILVRDFLDKIARTPISCDAHAGKGGPYTLQGKNVEVQFRTGECAFSVRGLYGNHMDARMMPRTRFVVQTSDSDRTTNSLDKEGLERHDRLNQRRHTEEWVKNWLAGLGTGWGDEVG